MQTIVCPHCKEEFEITEALHDQAIEKALEKEKEKYEEHLQKVREEEQKKAEKRVQQEMELKFKDSENERKQDRERIEKLMQDVLKTNEENRILKKKDEEREIEAQKTLLEEREKMKDELSKSAEEKAKFQILQITKQLEDTKKALAEAQRKSSQGSQQLQGEVLELELEQSLKTSFPSDVIEPVQKGIKGADISQTVRTDRGNVCGIILWELKRTKAWSEDWITKLKQDMLAAKSVVGIIVTETLPQEASAGFSNKSNILICSLPLALPIAELVRQQLIAIARERFILEHKNNKTNSERLFEYVTSQEFALQIQALADLRRDMRDQIDKERAAFEKIWKVREEQIKKLLQSTSAIHGVMQGITGNTMPQIKGIDLLEDGN